MLSVLAQANGQQAANPLVSLLFPVLLIAVFYFLLIRPQNQRRRAQMRMQTELQVGDDVVTTGGIYGTVTEIDDEFGIVTLEVAPDTEVRFARAAIAQRLVEDEEVAEEPEEAEPGS
jgi:preprotein translocase subunit YajC